MGENKQEVLPGTLNLNRTSAIVTRFLTPSEKKQ
jgi:hypothetical protein